MKKFSFILLTAISVLSAVSCKSGVDQSQYANRAEMIAAQIHDPNSKYVVVACHRGDWRNYPENSIPAIESIIRMGADIMELDLKLTKDSVLVLSHDKTIDRCTNGKGKVSDYTYEELMQFNLKRAHGVTTENIKMPTLREALECCKDRICVNVDQGYQYYDMVLAITEELGVTDQILIKGKKPVAEVAEKMDAHEHNMMYMPIVDIQKEKGMELFNEYMETGTVPLAYEVCWQTEDGTFQEVAKKIIDQGSKVWVNTIWASLCGGLGNDDDAAYDAEDPATVYDRYLEMGVSMIQTDRPSLIIPYLKSKGRH